MTLILLTKVTNDPVINTAAQYKLVPIKMNV